MALDVHLFPCLNDNYGLLIRDRATGARAAVDAPDADAVLARMQALGWDGLDHILNTHWHVDHTGGNARLQARTGCRILGPEEVRKAAPLDQVISDGETVRLGETRLRVRATPGHTLGHVIFLGLDEAVAFTGDTLFALGCGRLFEGTAAQMFDSLRVFDALPDETVVWCAHEYTEANARFALTQSDAPALRAHADDIAARRARGEATVPTTLGVERRFNPFLRAPDAETFGRLRAAKDAF